MLSKLDHVNVRTLQLRTMIDWYVDVLGMRHGERPAFSFDGAWLYIGDDPVVHLVEVDGDPGVGSESALKLEHFAFKATGRAAFDKKLKQINEPFRVGEIASLKIAQYNLHDPDGNHIHIDFSDND